MNIRKLAMETLLKINYEGAYSNLEVKQTLRMRNIKDEDRRLFLNLVYGCLQNQTYLDYLIQQQSQRSQKNIEREINEILRIAVYQIYFLDKIPHYAIVNESVSMAGAIQPRAKGFVNGVLRNIMRKIEKEGKEFNCKEWKNEKEALAVRYSIPLWIVHKYFETFGVADAEKIIPELNQKPPFTVRCNTMKVSIDQLATEFHKAGVESAKCEYSPNGLNLKNLGAFDSNIEKTHLFQEGYFTIQDQAALLTVERLSPKPGQFILDMCAAPGGKTTYLSQLMKNDGRIIARDVSERRLNLVKQSMNRLGCSNIELQVKDGCELLNNDLNAYDKILLDAPCTGLGVIRRKPEIKYHSTKEGRKALVKVQEKLLENAVNYLKIGGELLYSTCTVNSDENENQIRKLLAKFPDLKILPDESGKDFTYTSPLMDGCDSFFMCLIKK